MRSRYSTTYIGKAMRGREGIDPCLAQHVCREGEAAEDVLEGPVANIEPARISAERRQDHPLAVADEAAAADGPPAAADPCHRMQMTGDLAVDRAGLRRVPEQQIADGQRRRETSRDMIRRIGIVVAGDPQPIAAALQRHQRGTVGIAEPQRPVPVMEAVAERDDGARRSSGRSVPPPADVAAVS